MRKFIAMQIIRVVAWYNAKRRGTRSDNCTCCGTQTDSFLCEECEEAFRHLDAMELSRYVRSKRQGVSA